MTSSRLVHIALLISSTLASSLGCQRPPSAPDRVEPREARPVPDGPEAVPPHTEPVEPVEAINPSTPTPAETKAPREHSRPNTPEWLLLREVFDAEEPVKCEAKWEGRNRFRITTDNIHRVTLDMTQVPADAPHKGPWNVIIDGQAIELTGFKPKQGFTGHKRDLVRSPNGVWEVDKRRLYRPGE